MRTELWAGRLTAAVGPDGELSEHGEELLRRLLESDRPEAALALAAVAMVNTPSTGSPVPARYLQAGREALEALPRWAARMGRVTCEGAWYGRADRYGEQALAALSFRYAGGKEPHLLVVAVDQARGGLAVDAVVEEVSFLGDLDLAAEDAAVVAGRVLDAFEATDLVLGAEVAPPLPAVRPLALSRAHAVPGPVRHAPHGVVTGFDALPDLPGAREAFGALVEFLGERPLWWSPERAHRFLTSWLPREAILSEEAVAAVPEVVRAWTRHAGGHGEVLALVDREVPRLPALMADDSLAGPAKRMALRRRLGRSGPD